MTSTTRLMDTMPQMYSRSERAAPIPRGPGVQDLRHNRMAAFWRPLIDMGDAAFASVRLRLIRPLNSRLDEGDDRWSWCSRVSVPGLRHQVIMHAGLTGYACTSPSGLPEELRTSAWRTLVRSIGRFAELDWRRRAIVVFQLTQLSYHRVALRLAETVEPDGTPDHQRFRYEVARVAAATPGHRERALRSFRDLVRTATDPLLQVAAAFQGIGHSLRAGRENAPARWFEEEGRRALAGWSPAGALAQALVRSRLHRAVALLRRADGDPRRAAAEAAHAEDLHAEVARESTDDMDRLIAVENERLLVELRLMLELDDDGPDRAETIESLCDRLAGLDPFCLQARTTVGDAYVAIDRLPEAARWYENAGALGSGAGAIAWFKAARCHLATGDGAAARNAMGRCLELDPSAVEPRRMLAGTYDGDDEWP